MGLTIPALVAFIAELGAAQETVTAATAVGLHQMAETIMTRSKDEAPVETGNLRASGHVDPPEVSFSHVRVPLMYDAPYAIYVHEGHRIVAWGHDTGRMQPPNRFLLNPMLEAIPEIETALGTSVRAGLAQAFGR